MFDVVCEKGAQNVKVAHVVDRSGVSRRTFYEVFEDREDCLLAAFNDGVAYACERVLPPYRAARGGWRERVRGALIAFLGFLDEQPLVARLLVCESLSGGRVLGQRIRLLAGIARVVDQGREEADSDNALPVAVSLTAEGVLGGALAVIHARLLETDRRPLIDLANPLMSMIVLPYLGVAAAHSELARPIPARLSQTTDDNGTTTTTMIDGARAGGGGVVGGGDPFCGVPMRLTYRTVRVLEGVGRHPGASNRQVADHADIHDPGQVSRLLARLQRLGLLTNRGRGARVRGERNAWALTPKGQQVIQRLTVRPPYTPAGPFFGDTPNTPGTDRLAPGALDDHQRSRDRSRHRRSRPDADISQRTTAQGRHK